MTKLQVKSAFEILMLGMLGKSDDLFIAALSSDSVIYYKSENARSRTEFKDDVLNEKLNFFDYKIIAFDFDDVNKAVVVMKLLSSRHGMSKRWWNMRIDLTFVDRNDKVKICELRAENL